MKPWSGLFALSYAINLRSVGLWSRSRATNEQDDLRAGTALFVAEYHIAARTEDGHEETDMTIMMGLVRQRHEDMLRDMLKDGSEIICSIETEYSIEEFGQVLLRGQRMFDISIRFLSLEDSLGWKKLWP